MKHIGIITVFAGLLFSTTLSGQTGKNYLSDNEKGLTKEIVIGRLGQPDEYKLQVYEFENERQEYFHYGDEYFYIMNGVIENCYVTSSKCRMLTWLIECGITVGDNISKLLNSLGDIKYTKEKTDKSGYFIYKILIDDHLSFYVDPNGVIESIYYAERD